MEYLTYSEYIALGGVCDLTAFKRNLDRACSIIDSYTYGRVSKMAVIPLRVKDLCRDLVEYYVTNSKVNEKPVSSFSESAGDVSESVSYSVLSTEDKEKEIKDLIFDYLWYMTDDFGVPVLYKGANS